MERTVRAQSRSDGFDVPGKRAPPGIPGAQRNCRKPTQIFFARLDPHFEVAICTVSTYHCRPRQVSLEIAKAPVLTLQEGQRRLD